MNSKEEKTVKIKKGVIKSVIRKSKRRRSCYRILINKDVYDFLIDELNLPFKFYRCLQNNVKVNLVMADGGIINLQAAFFC